MVDKPIRRLSEWFKMLAAASLAAMMILTCFDVVGRVVGRPLLGAVEITGFLATLALAFSLPYAHLDRAHVGVEIITMRLKSRSRALVEAFSGVMGVVLFAAVAWKSLDYGFQMKASGEVSMTLQWPSYYVIFTIAASFAVLTLVQALDLVKAVRTAVTGREVAR